jgi:formylglycine-generating enzyme required for sulfatase activity
MVFVPGGIFTMGSNRGQPEERYTHLVRVDGFWIDRHEVTNAEFAEFISATGYVTVAERELDASLHPGIRKEALAPGAVIFVPPTALQRGGDITQWWQFVKDADWRHPEGPGSSIKGREQHPVVNITYDDALAYARWRGHDLPTEAQWEYAARGGRESGDDGSSAYDSDGKPIANTWQGVFPVYNSHVDGYASTAPVECFAPNGYGLYDMIGNVWEWTSDWYRPGHAPEPATNPPGPDMMSVRFERGRAPSRVIKGGSYLCSFNYCARYRPAARQPQEADLGAAHVGFRTVVNEQERF